MSAKPAMQTIEQFIVIDDDPSTLFLCKIIIERVFNKMTVVTYNNPKNAIDYFVNIFVDKPIATAIILDINMPEYSGWDVLDILNTLDNKVTENLTVVMLSSSIDLKDKLQATSHPLVLGYLEKPLTIVQLQEVMASKKGAVPVE